MGDSLRVSISNKRSLEARALCSKKQSVTYLASSASKVLSHKALKCITSVKQQMQGSGFAGDLTVFLVTTAALEVVRRFLRAHCPFVWRALQTLQVHCYPPFKWLQRWRPFKGLVGYTKFSLIILDIQPNPQMIIMKIKNLGQSFLPECQGQTLEKWLLELHMELKRQGISLPERLGDHELNKFYAAVNGDFPKLISSVKTTISWRQTYKLFQSQELEAWSHLVFWHGHDLRQRPCLIIRLGLASSNLQSNDRPLFIKAVVSQIEHGVLNLVKADQPQIMVLMDCQGLSPFGFPIHMMRSCATLLQDHYPDRLGCLLIIRLPQLAREITQTLFQVLKPATQRKVRTIGGNYREILAECLQLIPSFLGGQCLCSQCSDPGITQDKDGDHALIAPVTKHVNNDSLVMYHPAGPNTTEDRDRLRTIVIRLLILWVLIFLIFGTCYPGKLRKTLSFVLAK